MRIHTKECMDEWVLRVFVWIMMLLAVVIGSGVAYLLLLSIYKELTK